MIATFSFCASTLLVVGLLPSLLLVFLWPLVGWCCLTLSLLPVVSCLGCSCLFARSLAEDLLLGFCRLVVESTDRCSRRCTPPAARPLATRTRSVSSSSDLLLLLLLLTSTAAVSKGRRSTSIPSSTAAQSGRLTPALRGGSWTGSTSPPPPQPPPPPPTTRQPPQGG